MAIRVLLVELQVFLKSDVVPDQRSVNQQVIFALQSYRDTRFAQVTSVVTPEVKIAVTNKIRGEIQLR